MTVQIRDWFKAPCRLSSQDIREQVSIVPMTAHGARSRDGALSVGLSHFGYDPLLGPEVWIAKPGNPWRPGQQSRDDFDVMTIPPEGLVIPPHSFALLHTQERFRIPPHVMGICLGKSSWARLGLAVLMTPVEPRWGESHPEGSQLTLEATTSTRGVRLLEGDSICQLLFDFVTPYAGGYPVDGKYQRQDGIVLSRASSIPPQE